MTFIAGPDLLASSIGQSPLETLIHFGMTLNWIEMKIKNGWWFRYYVFPEQEAHLATWDALFKLTK